MHFVGELETHLTVHLPDDDEGAKLASLRAWAGREGLKFTHIVLARGNAPSQPMLTRNAQGRLATELAWAADLTKRLASAGLTVSRVKVEVPPWNDDVPAADDDAARLPADRYFEHHVKLLLPPATTDDGVGSLTSLAQRHGAHVSRNALRVRDDGSLERFVTQRCHAVGRSTVHVRLEALLNELALARHEVIDVEQEYVVHDSNIELDAGWIEAKGVTL